MTVVWRVYLYPPRTIHLDITEVSSSASSFCSLIELEQIRVEMEGAHASTVIVMWLRGRTLGQKGRLIKFQFQDLKFGMERLLT